MKTVRCVRRACGRVSGGACAAAGLWLAASGCATIGYGQPITEARIVRTRDVVVPSESVDVEAQQVGTDLLIKATRLCSQRTEQDVETTSTAEKTNTSAGMDIAVLGIGAGTALLGAVIVADAKNVYPDDTSSRQYNPLGQDTARGIGVATLATGGALMLIPVIDAIRATGSHVTTDSNVVDKGVTKTGVACGGKPAAGVSVYLRIGSSAKHDDGGDGEAADDAESGRALESIGATDEQGELAVDLAEAVAPTRLHGKNPPEQGTIMARGKAYGRVSLRSVRMEHAKKAWEALDLSRCAAADVPSACDATLDFLRSYPDGSHAAEAEATLVQAQTKLQAAREAEEKRRQEDEARAEQEEHQRAAAEANERQRAEQKTRAAQACRARCQSGCRGNASCVSACVAAKCK